MWHQLFHRDYVWEWIPNETMSLPRKMDALSRLMLGVAVLVFYATHALQPLLLVCVLVALLQAYQLWTWKQTSSEKEAFGSLSAEKKECDASMGMGVDCSEKDNPSKETLQEPVASLSSSDTTLSSYLRGQEITCVPTYKNPMGNVLLTDIGDHPDKLPAPPAFQPDVSNQIMYNTKRAVQRMNPTLPNASKQLFGDMSDAFSLEQANRVFYSTANTRVEPGDQTAFAQWCYGGAASAKESNEAGNLQRIKDNYRWTDP